MRRPENHVTRTMRENLKVTGMEWPEVSPRLVKFLEEAYPPRCKSPGESLEEHMLYAGVVRLIALMRAQVDHYADFTNGDPYDAELEAFLNLEEE